MLHTNYRYISLSIIGLFLCLAVFAKTDKYRCMWRESPATTMVIGWNQVSGSSPVLYYDEVDRGMSVHAYAYAQAPDRNVAFQGMNNQFVRLSNLRPNTTYYFIIQDSEGISQRMSFQTAPDSPFERLSIIAGGDSRNLREARRNANMLVGKLRPHCVLFGGDMTAGDTPKEWKEWLDDWQLTMTKEGRLTPIIPARGNHEASNQTLINIFDLKFEDVYYALTLGGDLLRVYTLNSMIASGGAQKSWLERDLSISRKMTWKMAQYHHSIRPHTRKKPEKHDLLLNWAKLFEEHGVNLVVESDIHVVKTTYPIRTSTAANSHEGFIRDDKNGVVYVGEGCWGAPLRENNDDKPWTRNSGSFNQFKWIFVGQNQIEVRTVQTDNAAAVDHISPYNIFSTPRGLKIWNPSNGAVISIPRKRRTIIPPPSYRIEDKPVLARVGKMLAKNFNAIRQDKDVIVSWQTEHEAPNTIFEIQRSLDGGKTYKPLSTVSGKGSGNHQYSYTDKNVAWRYSGTYVDYRLKHRKKDGQSVVSPSAKVPSNQSPSLEPENLEELTTHPIDKSIKISYNLATPAHVTIHLLDEDFHQITKMEYPNQGQGVHHKSLNLSRIAIGRYTLLIKANQKVVQQYKVVRR